MTTGEHYTLIHGIAVDVDRCAREAADKKYQAEATDDIRKLRRRALVGSTCAVMALAGVGVTLAESASEASNTTTISTSEVAHVPSRHEIEAQVNEFQYLAAKKEKEQLDNIEVSLNNLRAVPREEWQYDHYDNTSIKTRPQSGHEQAYIRTPKATLGVSMINNNTIVFTATTRQPNDERVSVSFTPQAGQTPEWMLASKSEDQNFLSDPDLVEKAARSTLENGVDLLKNPGE